MSTPYWRMDAAHHFGAFKGMASVNNICALREARGWSRPDLAKLMDTSPQQVERLEKGLRGLDLKWIDKAAHAFGVAPADIITAGADVKPRTVTTIEEIAADQGWALIEEVDLALGMGSTFLDSYTTPESLGIVPFKADWIRGFFRGSIQHLKVVHGSGDSMEPTIRDGDFVLIDTSRKALNEQDVVWAVSYGDLGMIRRLRQLPSGGISLMPDNPAVRPLDAFDGEMHILGRVVWIGRRM